MDMAYIDLYISLMKDCMWGSFSGDTTQAEREEVSVAKNNHLPIAYQSHTNHIPITYQSHTNHIVIT
jgi:hypothetical protein